MTKSFCRRFTDFENEILEVHNTYRVKHDVPLLTLNRKICESAQKRAIEMAETDCLSKNPRRDFGENIYCSWSGDPNIRIKPKEFIDMWYSKINEYSFNKEPRGHNFEFTQIIWRQTRQLGVGSAKSKSGKMYIVINYFPPGNKCGNYLKNVFPPSANQHRCEKKDGFPTQLIMSFKDITISCKFIHDFINAHNIYRRSHGVPTLELSRELSKIAEEWAMVLSQRRVVEHRDQNMYGENIFYTRSTEPKYVVCGSDPVDKWYSEINDYNFETEPTCLSTRHFTQVVWSDTRLVGVGIATIEGEVYVVANYFPRGNIMEEFRKMVLPPN